MDEGDGQEPGPPGGGDGEGRRPTEPGAVLRVPGPVQGKSLVFTPHVNPCLLTQFYDYNHCRLQHFLIQTHTTQVSEKDTGYFLL